MRNDVMIRFGTEAEKESCTIKTDNFRRFAFHHLITAG